MKPGEKPSELHMALVEQKSWLKTAMFFSVFTNILIMAPTLYMLEVYDRVVNSRSHMTLAMLTIMVVAIYAVLELLEWVRFEALQAAGRKFDQKSNARIFDAMFEANLKRMPGSSTQVLSDLRTVREFISSPAMLALMDVPLALLYVVVLFAINPILGYVSLAGALIQVFIAYLNERDTHPQLVAANQLAIGAQGYASSSLRNAQVIEAMGMQSSIHQRWLKKQNKVLSAQAAASDAAGVYASVSKFVQLAQSSLLLGIGCWLTIKGLFPGGGGLVIVASVIGARVLAPISQVISSWKTVVNARDAKNRLEQLLSATPVKPAGMPLPPPSGQLSVEGVIAAAPGSQTTILRGVSFNVPAGAIVAVIGPSAAGKSTLARLLMGIWPAASGKVRLDGIDIFSWNKAELGPHIGYLPQDVELFDGTLAENIARFGIVNQEKVEIAAKLVGIHDTLANLPNGYDTDIGDEGCFLSGGQRQRVGLARAIYGLPRFIVLDEPNSSLDEAGEQALLSTLRALKSQGTTVLIITHRTNVLAAVDSVLVLVDGQSKAFGPRDEVLAAMQRGANPAPAVQSRKKHPPTASPAAAGA